MIAWWTHDLFPDDIHDVLSALSPYVTDGSAYLNVGLYVDGSCFVRLRPRLPLNRPETRILTELFEAAAKYVASKAHCQSDGDIKWENVVVYITEPDRLQTSAVFELSSYIKKVNGGQHEVQSPRMLATVLQ